MLVALSLSPPRRVYDTMTGELLQELRRGADKADVYSIAFNGNSSMLAVTSDKGTVHIFRLREAVIDGSGYVGPSVPLAATSTGAATGAGASVAGGGAGATASTSALSPTATTPTPVAAATTGAAPGRTGIAGPSTSAAGGEGGVAASGAAAAGGVGAPAAGATAAGAVVAGAAHPEPDTNAKSSFSFMKGILPKYFSSEWSFAQFRVPDTRSIVAFGAEPYTIIGE